MREDVLLGQVAREPLNTEELARALRVSPRTVLRMADDGRIPSLKISERTRRYDLAAVLAALGTAAGELPG